MKKAVSVLLLLLFPFTNVLATKLHEREFELQRLCGASDESSEEKCDNNLSGRPTLKSEPFKVKYLLYKNPQNPDEYEEMFINNKSSILSANPYPKEKAMWKILVHGFTNDKDSQFPVNVKKAYLENLRLNPEQPNNILVFDWGDGAKIDWTSIFAHKGVYQNAVENVQIAGEILGDMITYLHKEGFLDIDQGLHIIGHSLGSHVAGQAARRVYNNTELLVWRISGLDPAGPLFWKNALLFWLHDPYPRLHRSRAGFLDVYHTSERYGSTEEMGDVDFYVNGGRSQPPCDNKLLPLQLYIPHQQCSHQFAPEIFARSINNKTMKACTGCFSYYEYRKGQCECEDTPVLGEYVTEEKFHGYPLASGQAFYDINDDIIGKL